MTKCLGQVIVATTVHYCEMLFFIVFHETEKTGGEKRKRKEYLKLKNQDS